MYVPVNPSFIILKWSLRGSKLERHVFVMVSKLSYTRHSISAKYILKDRSIESNERTRLKPVIVSSKFSKNTRNRLYLYFGTLRQRFSYIPLFSQYIMGGAYVGIYRFINVLICIVH